MPTCERVTLERMTMKKPSNASIQMGAFALLWKQKPLPTAPKGLSRKRRNKLTDPWSEPASRAEVDGVVPLRQTGTYLLDKSNPPFQLSSLCHKTMRLQHEMQARVFPIETA